MVQLHPNITLKSLTRWLGINVEPTNLNRLVRVYSYRNYINLSNTWGERMLK